MSGRRNAGFYPGLVLWIVDNQRHQTRMMLFDPEAQTGIIDEADLG
ncbi:hypothetical protein [Methylomonas albis]|uniref:Uncharacterized protein n=1 Tax=Methylomonas albis TaxID=1854563 RepID=A0ABR9D2N8_9GAMM|nr:hypothetical protein [Methylomonas albis]MBD9356499.1 hypothetical protein [Methylomonas albis]